MRLLFALCFVLCAAPTAAQMSTRHLQSSTIGTTTEMELTDLLTTVTVADATKTFLALYTVAAAKTGSASSTVTVRLRLVMDGFTYADQTLTLGSGTSTVQVYATHAGLALGSHTWRVYATVNTSNGATYQAPATQLFVANVDGTTLIDGFPVVPSTAAATLPAAGTPGRLARVTDAGTAACGGGGTVPTLCLDQGVAWAQVGSGSSGMDGADLAVDWTAAPGSGPQSSWRLTAPVFPTSAEFSSGVAPVEQVVMGAANAPAESTLVHVAGVAGYARSRSVLTGAVGVFGQGSSAANSPNAWGGNFVVENDGHNPTTMWGTEVDVNNVGTSPATSATNAGGLAVSGASTMQAPGTFAAYLAFPAGIFTTPNIKWKNAFLSAAGAADNGITLFQKNPTGASDAQDITFWGSDGTNLHPATIGADSTGTLQMRGAFDTVEALGASNSIMRVKAPSGTFLEFNSTGSPPDKRLFDLVSFGGSSEFRSLNDDFSPKNVYLHMDDNGGVTVGSINPAHSALEVPQGKYFQASNHTDGPPPGADCDNDDERGRITLDVFDHRLYVCMGAARGWDYEQLQD